MIAIDCQPVSIVKDIGFNFFVKAIEPRYTIPSRNYFSEVVIPRIHDGVSQSRAYETTALTWCDSL